MYRHPERLLECPTEMTDRKPAFIRERGQSEVSIQSGMDYFHDTPLLPRRQAANAFRQWRDPTVSDCNMTAEHLEEEVECQCGNANIVSEPWDHEPGTPKQDLI